MRLSNTQAVSRPVYYDRNPLTLTQEYNANVAPHAATTRWSYTVPAGRKAFIEVLRGLIHRTTVATAGSEYATFANFTKSGGAAITIQSVLSGDNTTANYFYLSPTQFGSMAAGDTLAGATYDLSTSGVVTYNNEMKGEEFDA